MDVAAFTAAALVIAPWPAAAAQHVVERGRQLMASRRPSASGYHPRAMQKTVDRMIEVKMLLASGAIAARSIHVHPPSGF